MDDKNETWVALAKGAIIWIGAVLGNITLSKLVLFATLVYTGLQIFVLVRDKIVKKKECDK